MDLLGALKTNYKTKVIQNVTHWTERMSTLYSLLNVVSKIKKKCTFGSVISYSNKEHTRSLNEKFFLVAYEKLRRTPPSHCK